MSNFDASFDPLGSDTIKPQEVSQTTSNTFDPLVPDLGAAQKTSEFDLTDSLMQEPDITKAPSSGSSDINIDDFETVDADQIPKMTQQNFDDFLGHQIVPETIPNMEAFTDEKKDSANLLDMSLGGFESNVKDDISSLAKTSDPFANDKADISATHSDLDNFLSFSKEPPITEEVKHDFLSESPNVDPIKMAVTPPREPSPLPPKEPTPPPKAPSPVPPKEPTPPPREPSPLPPKEPTPPPKAPSPVPAKEPTPPPREPSPLPPKEPTPPPREPSPLPPKEPTPPPKEPTPPPREPSPLPPKEPTPPPKAPSPVPPKEPTPPPKEPTPPPKEPTPPPKQPSPVKQPIKLLAKEPVVSAKTSKTVQEPKISTSNKDVMKSLAVFNPWTWFHPELLDPRVVELIYWQDAKKSGAVFGSILLVLLSLTFASLISVVAYTSLTVLTGTFCFRIYKNIMQAIQKSTDGHPFREFLEYDTNLPNEKVHEVTDIVVGQLNALVSELKRLFFVEDFIDSVKFASLLWLLTYIGSWFNGLTLVILAVVALFSLPKVYEQNQAVIDQYLGLVSSQVDGVISKIKAAIPIGNKEKSQ